MKMKTNRTMAGRAELFAKLFITFFLLLAQFNTMLNVAVLGPSLIDLEAITGATTSQLSTLFTIRGILFLVGCLVFGPLADYIGVYHIIGTAHLVNAAFYCSVPWCTSLNAVWGVLSPPEFWNTATSIGVPMAMLSLWKDDAGPAVQLQDIVGVVGQMIGPLIVRPFLSHQLPDGNTNASDHVDLSSSSTEQFQINTSTHLTNTSDWNNTVVPVSSDSNVSYAYVIVGLCGLVSGIGVFLFLFLDKCCGVIRLPGKSEPLSTPAETIALKTKPNDVKSSLTNPKEDSFSKKKIQNLDNNSLLDGDPAPTTSASVDVDVDVISVPPPYFVVKMSLLFAVLNFFYSGIEIGYSSFLMTFVVKYIGWSKETGTTMAAILEASNLAATLIALFTYRCIKPQTFLCVNMVAVFIASVLICTLVPFYPISIWPCTLLLGAGYGTIITCSYLWVHSFMEVSGKFGAAFWIGYSVGYSTIPALIGYLMDEVDLMCFPYVMLGCSVGMGLTFLCLWWLVNHRTTQLPATSCTNKPTSV